jgi:hypothetical protein
MAIEALGQSDSLYDSWHTNVIGQGDPFLDVEMVDGKIEATISNEALARTSQIIGLRAAEAVTSMALGQADVLAGDTLPTRLDFSPDPSNRKGYFDPRVGEGVIEAMLEWQKSGHDHDAVVMYKQFRAYVLSVIHNTDNYPNLRRKYPIPFSLGKHDIDRLLHQIYPTVIRTIRLTRANLPQPDDARKLLAGVLFIDAPEATDENGTDVLPIVAAAPVIAGATASDGQNPATPESQPVVTTSGRSREANSNRLSRAVLPVILGALLVTSVFGYFTGKENQRSASTRGNKGNSNTAQTSNGVVTSTPNPFVLNAAEEQEIVENPTVIGEVYTLYHEVYPNSEIQSADQLIRQDPQWVMMILGSSPVANTFATRSVKGAENELAINNAHPGYLTDIQLYYRNQVVSSRDWLEAHGYVKVGKDGVISFTTAFFNQVREMPQGTNEYNPLAMRVIGLYNDYPSDPGLRTQFMADILQAATDFSFNQTIQAAKAENSGVRGANAMLV